MAENSLDSKAFLHFVFSGMGREPATRFPQGYYCLVPFMSALLKTKQSQFSAEECLGHLLPHYQALLSEEEKMEFIHISNNLSSYQEVHFSNFSGKKILRAVSH